MHDIAARQHHPLRISMEPPRYVRWYNALARRRDAIVLLLAAALVAAVGTYSFMLAKVWR